MDAARQTSNPVAHYNAGAVTALANMAELRASKEDVFSVAADMDISFIDIDEGDKEKLITAFGDLNPPTST